MEEFHNDYGIKYFSFLSMEVVITIEENRYKTNGQFDHLKFRKLIDKINTAYADKWFRDRLINSEVTCEVIHIAKCAPILVSIKSTSECYKEIPVVWKNSTKYVNPRTRIIQDLGSPIPCSTIMNTYIKEQDTWYKFHPYMFMRYLLQPSYQQI